MSIEEVKNEGNEKTESEKDPKANEGSKPKDKVGKKGKGVWSFPTKSRCPRCDTTDTIAENTKKGTQYRRCLRAVCRHRYQVRGKRI